MLDNRINIYDAARLLNTCGSENIHAHQYNTALNRFNSTLFRGKILHWKSRIFHRRQSLYDLNDLKPGLHVRGSFYAGVKVVPIRSIIGSEGRTADFDLGFHPLNETSQERWVSLAVAYLSCLPLPPVQLIQIGEVYFVRDGHHRISVSQAFGQIAMDAEVIAWKASPPFPWQPCSCISSQALLTQQS